MATEKQLLSRIQLRYDTYANWSSTSLGDGKGANFVLKKGEIGLCSIPSGADVDGVQNPPHVMFKVGDGTSAFSALPWACARAADVYAWAKQASLPVTKEGTGNVVTGIAWDESTKGIKFTTAAMATADEMSGLSNRVKTIEDTYATDNDLSGAVATINAAIALKADKTYVDTELGKKVNTSDFTTFQTNNTAAIGTAKSEAIAAAKTETEKQVKALADDAVKANTDAIRAIKDGANLDSFADVEAAIGDIVIDTLVTGTANGTVKFNGTDVAVKGLGSAAYTNFDAYATAAQGAKADSAVQSVAIASGSANGKIKLTVDGTATEASVYGLGSAAYTEAGAYATSAQGAKADSAVQSVKVLGETLTDGGELTVAEAKTALGLKSAAYAETTAFDAAGSAATAKDEAIAAAANDAASKYATIKAAEDAQKAADDANAKIDAFMADDAAVTGAIDTLVEINKYITEDTEAFTALSGRVDKLEDGTVAAKEAEHADVASSLDAAGIAQVQGIKVNNATNADVAAKASGLDASGEAAVKAVKVDNATHSDTTSGLDNTAVEQVKGIKVNNAANADKAADSDKLGGVVAANYALKTDAQGYADAALEAAKADAKSKADAALEAAKADATSKANAAQAAAEGYADSLAGNYATAAQGAKADTAIQSGTFAGKAMTKTGTALSISQADARTALGLGTAAYKAEGDFATAAQGALADSALQKADITTGSANGTIAVEGTDVAVKGLGSAAYTETSAYATAAQGTKADSALQSVEVGTGLKVSTKAENKQTVEIDTDVIFVLYGGTASEVI